MAITVAEVTIMDGAGAEATTMDGIGIITTGDPRSRNSEGGRLVLAAFFMGANHSRTA
jgi:hypothetical protein